MSCQTQPAATRAFTDTDKHASINVHRSVRFSSESRGSVRSNHDAEKRETSSGALSLTSLSVTPMTSHVMSQSAPTNFDIMSNTPPTPQSCRFPKLEECAHFHYERVSLGTLSIEMVPCDNTQDDVSEGWVYLKVRSHVNAAPDTSQTKALSASWTDTDSVSEWTLSRSADNFIRLDDLLHRCIYDRKVSGLPNLTERLTPALINDTWQYQRLIADYVHHFSIIADDSINCGPVLNWLQCDNKGHRLLVSDEDSSSINTPAVAAAYSVRKYVSQARDEISFDVGDMISIIDMPGPQESVWWRGKRGFRVGFFPQQCVCVIGDKVPRHMTTPPPIVGSVALAPIKPVLRKHGKLISLFRSFILSRPSRRSLKQQGILKERVFGCDLGEHLLNCGHDVPVVVSSCTSAIEQRGAVDGIYRLSGGAGLTHRLRAAFDAGRTPDLAEPDLVADPHAVPSLLKMYFRELPNPLCTYQLYDALVAAVQQPEDRRLRAVKHTLFKLPPPHYRTLSYLMRHLRRVSLLQAATGMTSRNMAIVWAPNLLRASHAQHALQGVAVQAVITEFLICYAEELFSEDQASDTSSEVIDTEEWEQVELRGTESTRRPKSLPIHQTSKLLSLEEARRRGGLHPPKAPQSTVTPAHTNTQSVCLRPTVHLTPNYIEVGSGPNNLPQYHTVLDLPAPGSKRGLKRSPSGWRGLFSRNKVQRPPAPVPLQTVTPPAQDVCMTSSLRPVKSCESVTSLSDNNVEHGADAPPNKHHTRSSSCDSYFESWQAELASMRLRLAPQERTNDMFTEEQNEDSSCSEPGDSTSYSIEPSPRKNLKVDIEAANENISKRSTIEEQLSSIGYIDVESPRARNLTEKRSCRPASPNDDLPKRLCTDRDSPLTATTDFQASLGAVKMRERNSPRKTKCASRYSGVHQPLTLTDDRSTVTPVNTNVRSRLTWHGKDGHSTLIKIDWPIENSSVSNLTTSTLNSSPLTPVTPVYDVLDSDSEVSEANKHTIEIKSEDCDNCDQEKCLKCELKATDYGHLKVEDYTEQNINDSPEHSIVNSTDISYQNLNRLSAVSTSSNSEPNSDRKKDHNYENCETKLSVMSSSHESSSSYSNISPTKQTDELFDCHTAKRPNYINLQSSSTSKSSPGTPLKSPLKSTISITFRSPTKSKSPDYEIMENMNTPTNDRDYNVYEDLDLEKNLSIVEEAPVPEADASLPTQQACQPQDFTHDLIILETPTDSCQENDVDVYSQVKFFKKSIDEVNAMILESPNKEIHYENVNFGDAQASNHYNEDTLQICDKDIDISDKSNDIVCEAVNIELPGENESIEKDNGNIVKTKVVQTNLNVRELANIFESPTEQKAPFTFDKFKTEIKYSTLERKDEDKKAMEGKKQETKPASPKYNLSKNSCTARSLDENAFVKEFGSDKSDTDRRKSLEVKDVKKTTKYLPDLNLNLEENDAAETKVDITPTSENKISLIQRFNDTKTPDIKTIIGTDTDNLSRERIEKYKEERRNFLREKYSSQSFRSNPEHLTRIKLKKDDDKTDLEQTKAFERRNTVDLGQRMRFSLARSANNLDSIHSPESPDSPPCPKPFEDNDGQRNPTRQDPSIQYNIRDMTAMFEQKSLNSSG